MRHYLHRPSGLSIVLLLAGLLSHPLVAAEAGGERGLDATSVPVAADLVHNAFGHALANLDPADWPRVLAGKAIFVRAWQPAGTGPEQADGLAPLYNPEACTSCHFKDGRGGPRRLPQPPPPLIFRLGADPLTGARPWGGQLQDQAISGSPEGKVEVGLNTLSGRYGDGEPYLLGQPVYGLAGSEPLPLSPRQPPTLVGIGLLEAADPRSILAWEDPTDRDRDGISGRARWVETPSGRRLGRFGWKAGHPDLPGQVAAALAEDMGITSAHHLNENGAQGDRVEIATADFDHLVGYLRSLAPPSRRRHPALARGEALFASIGCAACHRPRLTTGSAEEIAGPVALAGQELRAYTDLLLHDLGEGLADGGPVEEGVGPGEWRTAPLWGLGLLEAVNGGLYLLHDGRARSFEEAILWHGGEALVSRRRFQLLEAAERQALVDFLSTL